MLGLETGIPTLDKEMLGLQGITTVQGEPGCNKSTLCLQIALNVAQNGHPVLMLDRENGKERVRLRSGCSINKVSQVDVMTATEDETDEWMAEVWKLPFYVMNENPDEPDDILELVRELYKQYRKPVLVVVDSVQAMPKIHTDPQVNMQDWYNFLDQVKIRAEGKVYILVVSEKKRGAYDDAQIDGGKGSNAIEYKSEVVLDLRLDKSNQDVVVQCKKFRDGLSNFKFRLRKQLAQQSNKRSFTFKLEEYEDETEDL